MRECANDPCHCQQLRTLDCTLNIQLSTRMPHFLIHAAYNMIPCRAECTKDMQRVRAPRGTLFLRLSPRSLVVAMSSDNSDTEAGRRKRRKQPGPARGGSPPGPSNDPKRRKVDDGPRYVKTASRRKGKTKETIQAHRLKKKDVPEGAESLKVRDHWDDPLFLG